MKLIGIQHYWLDRLVVSIGIGAISLLSWSYMFGISMPGQAGHSHDHATMTVGTPVHWDTTLLRDSTVMWSVMMVAMMLPTASPMILSYIRVHQRRQPARRTLRLTGIFILGYVIAWVTYSVLAGIFQWTLHGLGLMTSAMGSLAPDLSGVFLVAAGVFQWSGLKDRCLSKCQSPIGFLLNEWRDGAQGALLMGLRHGLFCIGCCWMLMLLMFVGGVMNLLWMAVISIYVLAEKLVPGMRLYGRVTGIVLIIAGIGLLEPLTLTSHK